MRHVGHLPKSLN